MRDDLLFPMIYQLLQAAQFRSSCDLHMYAYAVVFDLLIRYTTIVLRRTNANVSVLVTFKAWVSLLDN